MSEAVDDAATLGQSAEESETDYGDMLTEQMAWSALTLKYTMASNMLAASTAAQKSMCEKIGQS